MVYGCGNKCIKFLVFFFNFLVCILGLAILITSLVVRFDKKVQGELKDILKDDSLTFNNTLYTAIYVLIAIGAFLFLTGFLGCCGAWCENTCLLSLFFAIVLILFVAELGVGIYVLVKKDEIKKLFYDEVGKQFKRYHEDPNLEKAVDKLQQENKCCGCQDPKLEFGDKIPSSCYATQSPLLGQFTTHCCDKMWNDINSNIVIIGGVAIGLLVIELLAMIFSCCLCQAFRRGDYMYA